MHEFKSMQKLTLLFGGEKTQKQQREKTQTNLHRGPGMSVGREGPRERGAQGPSQGQEPLISLLNTHVAHVSPPLLHRAPFPGKIMI